MRLLLPTASSMTAQKSRSYVNSVRKWHVLLFSFAALLHLTGTFCSFDFQLLVQVEITKDADTALEVVEQKTLRDVASRAKLISFTSPAITKINEALALLDNKNEADFIQLQIKAVSSSECPSTSFLFHIIVIAVSTGNQGC